jgi:hypothetical protein
MNNTFYELWGSRGYTIETPCILSYCIYYRNIPISKGSVNKAKEIKSLVENILEKHFNDARISKINCILDEK